MRRLSVIAVGCGVLGLSYCIARQGQVGQWKNYTDMESVTSVAFASQRVVAATGGGMFMYDETSGKYSRYTNSENLSSNDLTALMADANNRIWLGSSTGSIDVLNVLANSWQSIQDVANSNRPQKAIRGFFEKGDSVYVVSDFGVSVFSISRWEFGDTYADFGFVIRPAITEVLVQGNQIFVGTSQGVAVASLSSPNLQPPTSWTIYTGAQGLSSASVNAMIVYRDTLLVGTADGIFFFTGSSFQQLNSTAGKYVTAFLPSDTSLYFAWIQGFRFRVESFGQINGTSNIIASNDFLQATSLAFGAGSSSLLVGTTTQGVAEWDGSRWQFRLPNGPQSNLFVSLCVDPAGVLWAGSGIGGGGKGFYRFNASLPDNDQWKSFTADRYPILNFNDYYKASVGGNGSMWMSSWGDGIVEVVKDTIRRKLNAISTPSFTASVPDPFFVVIGGEATDPQGANWFANRTAVNGNFLAKMVNDSTLQYFRCTAIQCDGFFASIMIDQNGTKWMANSEPTQKYPTGLYYFNESLSVAGTDNTGGWGLMTVSDGLTNNTILSVAVDLENSVWIGTDLGVTIITDPQNPKAGYMSSFPLREQSIQAIAVDGLNDKWIGTKEGVFVVNSDGTQLLSQYTTINTSGKLVDNDVRAITIDQHRGIVYVGTQKGLSSLQIAAVQPLQSYTALEFGPNPFVLPNSQPMSINHLVSNSTIKILSVNGTLITEFAAQGGGRAFWDGRDRRGNYVPTGIYFVIAFAENGNQVANGKVAIVRK